MKRLLFLGIAVLVLFTAYWYFFKRSSAPRIEPDILPIALKKHSAAFNSSIDSVVNAYLAIKNAFLANDTLQVKNATRNFIQQITDVNTGELNNDTSVIRQAVESAISDIRANAESLTAQTDISEMKQDFRMVTEMMYPGFFKTINYDGQKLYLFYCENALGYGKSASWISNNTEIKNPYSSGSAPGSINCGEIKDTIKAR